MRALRARNRLWGGTLVLGAVDSTLLASGGLAVQADGVPFVDRRWNGSQVVSARRTADDVNPVPSDGNMSSGWYYLDRNVTVSGRTSITGDTYLVLGDNCKLDVKGLYVPKGSTLMVFGQSEGGNAGEICTMRDFFRLPMRDYRMLSSSR